MYLDEATRVVMPQLGFNNPYDFVAEYGISYYESIIISQWSIVPILYETVNCPLILDRSPIDNLAYYYMLREENERKYESILVKLCQIYCKYIDSYLFIPSGVFDLKPDYMQVKETQQELERIIKSLLIRFNIEYQVITQKSIYERCCKIQEIVEELFYGYN